MRFKQIVETTTAGSVATVAQPMMTQTRENTNVRGLKPVQQVMKGAKKKGPYANSIVESKVTEDDLAEQDLIVIPGQGRLRRTGFVKHDLDQGEHEGHTLKNSLHTIARAASDLDKRLSVQSEFPEWVSEKIGAAKGMMVTVMDYLISSQEMQHDSDAINEGEVSTSNLRTMYDLARMAKNYCNPEGQESLNELLKILKWYMDQAEQGVAEGLGKDIKRLATGKDVKSRAGQEIAKSQDASMKGDTKTSKKHFDRYDRLDKLANKEQGVAEGSLNEFAPNGFDGGNDGEEFNPRMAKMAYDEGNVKGASLADGATLERAMAINDWDKHDGGIYKQHFAKGFKAGRMDKIRHNNKQYNLNLKLMKDGSIRHGEQGVAEDDLDEACWKDYKQLGMKKKGDKQVPNCVPKEGVEEGEADYGPEYQAMVARVGQRAKEGPRKTVWDPVKRVYKTVPINPPKDAPVKEKMMPASNFVGSKKNKLGTAGQLKATADHARQGDLVGGSAEESIRENWELAMATAITNLIERQLK